jgi:hypothetical protein
VRRLDLAARVVGIRAGAGAQRVRADGVVGRPCRLSGQEIKLFKLGRMPAQVLIDKAGVARYVHYGHSMSDIPENAEILALADELNESAGDQSGAGECVGAGAD